MTTPTISLGMTTVTAAALDATIERYLPASIRQLRVLCEERSGESYADKGLSEFLIMLADWDHNTDSSPFSIDTCRKACSR